MNVRMIQLCCRNEVIAWLEDGRDGRPTWFCSVGGGAYEVIENEEDLAVLNRALSALDFAGYMVFRCREYDDVQTCVIL